MSMTFTKLFSSITESTIWVEDHQTRIVWITMLAMADAHGRVWGSIPGLANRARVSVAECEAALEKFKAPDKYSRTSENDGRRVECIDGGWRLLNHAKYRAIRDEEAIKESKRKYINTRREIERVEAVEQSRTQTNAGEQSRANAEADTEAEANTDTESDALKPLVASAAPCSPAKKKPRAPVLTDEQWIADLERDSTYAGINVRIEHGKMMRWCEVKGKMPTRARFVSWLGRAERPLGGDPLNGALMR